MYDNSNTKLEINNYLSNISNIFLMKIFISWKPDDVEIKTISLQ